MDESLTDDLQKQKGNGVLRGPNGRLLPGTAAVNPGGRPRSTKIYLKTAMRAVSPAQWSRIVKRARDDALNGDKDARAWLSKIFGLDRLAVEVVSEMDAEGKRLASLSPLDLLNEYRQRLERLGGSEN